MKRALVVVLLALSFSGLAEDMPIITWSTPTPAYESNLELNIESVQRNKVKSIVCNAYDTVGLKNDGSLLYSDPAYEGFEFYDHSEIAALFEGNPAIVLLKDGSVRDWWENETINSWQDIVSVSGDLWGSIGLRSDGTLVTYFNEAFPEWDFGQCNVDNWRDIKAISCGLDHTIGLKKDGTVIAAGQNDEGQCDIENWHDIVEIKTGDHHTVGLKKDGTVIAVGNNDSGQCNVSGWRDIVEIDAGLFHTVGLKNDGTVIAVGWNEYGQCNVKNWCDIIAICCGSTHTVGLKSDGTVVAVGENEYGQCNVSDWQEIRLY